MAYNESTRQRAWKLWSNLWLQCGGVRESICHSWPPWSPSLCTNASFSKWVRAIPPLSKRASDAVLDLDLAYVRAVTCFPLWVHAAWCIERQGGASLRHQLWDYKAMSDVLPSAVRITPEKPQIPCSRDKRFCQTLCMPGAGNVEKKNICVYCFKSLSFRAFIQERCLEEFMYSQCILK